jgi:nitrate reductase NapE component
VGHCNCSPICNNIYDVNGVSAEIEPIAEENQEWVVNSSIVLISAVFASLAIGVLVAYGICMAMFGIFRIHARQVAAEKSAQNVVARVVEG